MEKEWQTSSLRKVELLFKVSVNKDKERPSSILAGLAITEWKGIQCTSMIERLAIIWNLMLIVRALSRKKKFWQGREVCDFSLCVVSRLPVIFFLFCITVAT